MFTKIQTKKITDGDEWGNRWQAEFGIFIISIEQMIEPVEVSRCLRGVSHYITSGYEVEFICKENYDPDGKIAMQLPEGFSLSCTNFSKVLGATRKPAHAVKANAIKLAVEELRDWLEALPEDGIDGLNSEMIEVALNATKKGGK